MDDGAHLYIHHPTSRYDENPALLHRILAKVTLEGNCVLYKHKERRLSIQGERVSIDAFVADYVFGWRSRLASCARKSCGNNTCIAPDHLLIFKRERTEGFEETIKCEWGGAEAKRTRDVKCPFGVTYRVWAHNDPFCIRSKQKILRSEDRRGLWEYGFNFDEHFTDDEEL